MKVGSVLRVGGVAAAAAVVAVVVFAGGRRARSQGEATPHAESAHGAGLDWANAPLDALMKAPEGATPCESAFNALDASQRAAKETGRPSLFTWVAPRDEFIARCGALPPDAQKCVVPRYDTLHHDECQKLRPPKDALAGLFTPLHPDE